MHPLRLNRSACLLLWAVLPCGVTALAAEPRDPATFLPKETLAYVGWYGCDQTKDALAETAWGMTLADPQVKRFKEQLWYVADFFAKRAAAGEEATAQYEALRRILQTLVQRPTALGIVDFGLSETGPGVKAAIVCHIGEGGSAFLTDVQALLAAAQMPQGVPFTIEDKTLYQLPVPLPGGLFYGLVGEHFLVAVGAETAQGIVKQIGSPGPSLAQNDRLLACRKKIGGSDRTRAMTIFVDLSGALERVQKTLPIVLADDPQKLDWARKVISLVGADSLDALTWELHFKDGGCYHASYLRYQGQASGVFALASTTPLTDADLAVVPRQPSWALAFNLDCRRFWGEIRELVTRLDPDAGAEISENIGKAEAKLGLRFDEDLLNLLGDTFVIFDAPENGGLWLTGVTLALDTHDPARFQQTLDKLVQLLAREIEDRSIRMQVSSTEYRGHLVKFVNLTGVPMPVAPAWTAHEKRLIVALYPQMVTTALDRLLDGDPRKDSLPANADFQRGVKVMGGLGSAVQYIDTPRGAGQLYTLLLPAVQMGAAMAQGEGATVDIAVFPTRTALTRHLFGHVQTTRCDAEGVLSCAFGPLPVPVPALTEGGGFTAPMLVSILLPSLSRARELAKRAVSASNLKGIGTCCQIYANDNQDRFPPDLQTLVAQGYLPEEQLRSPKDGPGQTSYVYIAGQTANDDPRNLLAHEREDLNYGEGVNVLYVDGHVAFQKLPVFQEELRATQERLSRKKARTVGS
ncbi:MAG TPA: hypothetical protein PKK06_04785 [Phycisphaerae bacterium]|nr:hypothetical protein [Phycisphaerae bacterium]HNU45155.1 hypothetical protein [Phycisphaerae bacterium]